MGIFGGVQVISILCSIIRTKLVAMWIGPAGVGLFALYNSATDMIGNISGLGIRNSSVRDISIESETCSRERIATILSVVRRWSWFLGLAGAIIIISIAPILSKITFGDDKHIWGFVALSVTLLINALANGEYAILQGTARLRRLAHSTTWGVAIGVILSAPLFYYFKIDSIIPALIIYSVSCGASAWFFRNKDFSSDKKNLTAKDTFNIGKGFIKLGIFMTCSDIITQITFYGFVAYLNHNGGTDIVGYYQTGYTLINKYAALILSALGVEYYPRLAKVSGSVIKTNMFVTKEINIALTFLVPIVSLFIVCRELIINILFTPQFLIISQYISFAIIGTLIRAVSWCMAFVILARGNGKLFLMAEIISTIAFIILYIPCYQRWGITGFGYAFIGWYLIYAIFVAYIYFNKFNLSLKSSCLKWLIWGLAISSATLFFMEINSLFGAIICSILAVAVSCFSFKRFIL